MAQEYRLAGEQLGQSRAALLARNAHVDHRAAEGSRRRGLHIARRIEHQHRPGEDLRHGLQHGQLVVVDNGVIGVLVPGEDHHSGGVVLGQLLHGQAPPGQIAGGMAQGPGPVLVGQQAVGLHQLRGAEPVQHIDAVVGHKLRAGEDRPHLAHAEHGYRQLLRALGPERQGVVNIFQKNHAPNGRRLGRTHVLGHPWRKFHGNNLLMWEYQYAIVYHIFGPGKREKIASAGEGTV